MNKKLIIAGVLTVAILYFAYTEICSSNARKGKKNQFNSEKIIKGMNKVEVYKIMGKPDTIMHSRIAYITNDDSYPYIEVSFDENGNVFEIYSPKKHKIP